MFPSTGSRVYFIFGGGRTSHLRRAIFGPSKWPAKLRSVRAIHVSGQFSRETANMRRPIVPLHYFNLLTRGPSMARLLLCGTGHFWPTWYLHMRRPGRGPKSIAKLDGGHGRIPPWTRHWGSPLGLKETHLGLLLSPLK